MPKGQGQIEPETQVDHIRGNLRSAKPEQGLLLDTCLRGLTAGTSGTPTSHVASLVTSGVVVNCAAAQWVWVCARPELLGARTAGAPLWVSAAMTLRGT